MKARLGLGLGLGLGVMIGCRPAQPAGDTKMTRPSTTAHTIAATVLVEPFGRPDLQPALIGTAGSERAAPAELELRFDWQAPCRVPGIAFESNNDGGSNISEFTLELERVPDGIELHFTDLRVRMLADVRLGEDAAQRERAVVEAATLGSMPTRVVGPNGQDLGPGDRDAAIGRAVAPLEDEDAASIAEALRAEDFTASVDAAGERLWRSFVGEWLGYEAHDSRATTAIWRERPVDETQQRRNLGRVQAGSGLVLLETERRLEGPAFVGAVLAAAAERAEAEGREPPAADAISDAHRTELISAAIDPTRGLPHHVLYQSVFVVNDKQQFQVEEWSLDWASAVGCGFR